ncbi:MAG: DUF3011 domain-containing protein [bacterium]
MKFTISPLSIMTLIFILGGAIVTPASAETGPLANTKIECGAAPANGANYCPLPEYVTRVALATPLSHAPCIFGESWGLSGTEIWTSKGCVGSFYVEYAIEAKQFEKTIKEPAVEKTIPPSQPYYYQNGVFLREA